MVRDQAEKLFLNMDENKDGRLDRDELIAKANLFKKNSKKGKKGKKGKK